MSNPFVEKPIFVSHDTIDIHGRGAEAEAMTADEHVPPVPPLPAAYSELDASLSPSRRPFPGHYGSSSNRQTSSSPTRERHANSHDVSSRSGSSATPEQSSSNTDDRRGRAQVRPQTPHTENGSPQRKQSKTPKRSQSPIKRLLGIGKSTPSKDHEPKTMTTEQSATGSQTKRSLKDWSYKIKNGFLATDAAEEEREKQMEDYYAGSAGTHAQAAPSRFPISLDPSYQARLQADLELMIVVSANRFLVREARAGRLTRRSIDKFRGAWESNNLPQVIEYQFDMATQRAIIMDNIKTVEFCGTVAENPLTLAATLHSWTTLIYEISVRTFCTGDSVIRKWLNDGQRILEMLGAPYVTFSRFDKMSTKALLVINHRQRIARANEASEAGSTTDENDPSTKSTRNISESSYVFRPPGHLRSISNDSYVHGLYGSLASQMEALDAVPMPSTRYGPAATDGPPQAVIAQVKPQSLRIDVPTRSGFQDYQISQNLPRDAYEESRGGRLGLMRNATPAASSYRSARQSPTRNGVREL
jgi:hypothetical protein